MSFNVADGFIFLAGPECFPPLIRGARSALGREAEALLKQRFLELAVAAFDRHTLIAAGLSNAKPSEDRAFMSGAFRKLKEDEKWLDCSIAIHETDGRYYGRLFSPHPKLRSRFLESPFIAPFGFWDNTDKDPDVPDDEWEYRSRVWHEIDRQLSNGIFNLLEARLTLTSHLVHTELKRDEISTFMPDFDSRVAAQIRDLALQIAATQPIDTGQIMTIVDGCASGRMPLARHLAERVRPLLKPAPDAVDLWGWQS